MTDLREVAAFLLGEGELDGVGFGDPHPTERGNYWWRKHLRAALAQQDHLAGMRKMVAQPEPEPVAWMHTTATGDIYFRKKPHDKVFSPQPVYTAPPQREWKSITGDEIWDEWCEQAKPERNTRNFVAAFARAIEAKLKEKNT